MKELNLTRRRIVLTALGAPALGLQSGCRTSLPPLRGTETTPAARALLASSADVHGAQALSTMHDVNVSYFGTWHRWVDRLQPALVDAGFRGGSEERILVGENLIGQSHSGARGHKQVVRYAMAKASGELNVWFNGQEAHDDDRRHAAALVADAYTLFLFGPMLIERYLRAGRSFVMDVVGTEAVIDGQRRYDCELLRVQMKPGIGLSDADQLALFIDRDTGLMRRVRFSLEGLESTRGALVEVDTLDPVDMYGVKWPTRFSERLLRPAPLKVHDWRLTGLDVNRGYAPASINGVLFTGSARRSADVVSHLPAVRAESAEEAPRKASRWSHPGRSLD